MDKTYARLVATRDAASKTLAGVIDVDASGTSMVEHVAWRQAVEACVDAMGVLTLAGALPAGIKAHPQGQALAFALLQAQQSVVGYVPPTTEAKLAKLTVKANKAGGLYVSKPGRYSLNLPSVATLMLLEADLAEIRAALKPTLRGDSTPPWATVTEAVPSANGSSHKYRKVVRCGDYVVGDECHRDAVDEWLA